MKTMRAAVLTAPRRMAVVEQALPQPGPGQVRLRVEGCGVCGSNLVPWEGPQWMSYPSEPGSLGHEAWGTIDALGDGVTGLSPGQRVAALSYRSFAEYDVAAADSVVPLPPQLEHQPVPGEALGCVMNIFERSGIERGQTVAVVGIGFLGALLTQLAVRAGARVIAISRRPYALEVARRMGAQETIAFESRETVQERVRQLTGDRWCERVLECVGNQAALDLCTELTGERGRLVIAGYHQDGPRSVNLWLWNWRGIDVVNAHERDPARYLAGMRAAVRAIEEGRLDPSGLYTHHFPLEGLGAALEATRERPDGFLKAVVCP